MEEHYETFTVLIARINRSIKRIKSAEMAEFQLKGPYVSCLYYLSLTDGLTAAALCERCDELQKNRAALPCKAATDEAGTRSLPRDEPTN